MGWAERMNQNSAWSKKRTMNLSSQVASPVLNSPQVTQVSTPAYVKRDEPMVIEINFQSIWSFLCRILKTRRSQSQSLALTN